MQISRDGKILLVLLDVLIISTRLQGKSSSPSRNLFHIVELQDISADAETVFGLAGSKSHFRASGFDGSLQLLTPASN